MIEHLPAALTTLQTAMNVGKAMVDVNDSVKSQSKLIEFNRAIILAQQLIISAQQEQTTLLAEIERLKKENEELLKWQRDSLNYIRKEIASGVFAYVKSDTEDKLSSTHKYCCSCHEKNETSTLQQFHVDRGRKIGLKCPNGCPDIVFHAYVDMY
jgi:type II secretory pathway pseudopilin PulG